ncbi:hypothetical protein [Robertmurraya andreesenii]|uniref:Plantaricin C family lantibiotic n=1 Tax=Anoxybacillus andreesenii TaxID=1325932 RepID=A0ABT9V6D6_9BACL|nr:hypothetical protein [Robertmurraya andreesenii]MDQ0156482.1 hypothetical protein [Robertmurraya andreesenii]
MNDITTNGDRPELEKNVSSVTGELNSSSEFGIGIVTGTQEIEADWSLCITLCCCSCSGGGGGGSSQLQKTR